MSVSWLSTNGTEDATVSTTAEGYPLDILTDQRMVLAGKEAHARVCQVLCRQGSAVDGGGILMASVVCAFLFRAVSRYTLTESPGSTEYHCVAQCHCQWYHRQAAAHWCLKVG